MFLIFAFYPLVPAVIYAQVLWVWGIRKIEPESLEKMENLACQIRGISGGFEAPLQLTMTIWLMLKGVLYSNDVLNIGWSKGSYGNLSPSIPFISALSSFITIISTCVRLNHPLPYQAYSQTVFRRRYSRQFSLVLGHLPHYICSSLFRVSSLAFIWIYLALYALIPILVLLLVNILIFYKQEDNQEMKEKTKSLNKRMKLIQKRRKDNSKYKYRKICQAIWLSSFIGIFIPCCYTKPIETNAIHKLDHHQEILKQLDVLRDDHKRKVLKLQELAGTGINLIAVIIIYFLVNLTSTGYMDNCLDNFSFHCFFTAIVSLGVINLVFIIIGFDLLQMFGLGVKKGRHLNMELRKI